MADIKDWRKKETWGYTHETWNQSMIDNALIEKIYWDLWLKNCFEAMTHKLPFISELYGSKKGKGAIVCGAGPSLKKQADAVIKAASASSWLQYDIIATDRSLKTVRELGLKEFLTITTECQPDCGTFLESAGKGDKVVCNLITCPETRNALIERGSDVFHTYGICHTSHMYQYLTLPDNLGPDIGCFRPNSIVGAAALDHAFWLGYDPIVLIGNDLCYDDVESCINDTGPNIVQADTGLMGTYVCRLEDGRWTFSTFIEAGARFLTIAVFHGRTNMFFDASRGITALPQIDLMAFADGIIGLPTREEYIRACNSLYKGKIIEGCGENEKVA